MKRKLLTTVSLLLALALALPTAVLAEGTEPVTTLEETGSGTETPAQPSITVEGGSSVIYAGGTRSSVKLTAVNLPEGVTVTGWGASNDTVSVSGSGNECTVTAVKGGDPATIVATYIEGGAPKNLTTTITVVDCKIDDIRASVKDNTVFYIGEAVNRNNLLVEIKNNETNTYVSTDDYTVSPSTITADTTLLTITYSKNTTLTDTITDIPKTNPPTEADFVSSISIVSPTNNKEYTVGDTLKMSDVELRITYSSIFSPKTVKLSDLAAATVSGDVSFNSNKNYTFPADKAGKTVTLTVNYANAQPATVNLKVKAKDTKPSYKLTVDETNFTKRTYKVGDTFDGAGMKFTIKCIENGVERNIPVDSSNYVTVTPYVIKDADKGKTQLTITLNLYINGAPVNSTNYIVKNLTIKAKTSTLDIYSIYDFELEQEKYPVGYEFSSSDVEKIRYREYKNGATRTVYGYELDSYTNFDDLELLVLDKDDEDKRKRESTIEDDDVRTDSKGSKYVKVRLVVDDEDGREVDYEQTVSVGDSGVKFYYDGRRSGDLITTYDDIFDALEYTVDQDDDVKDKFDLDDVDDDEEIILVLGENQEKKTDGFYRNNRVDLCHNVVIDLNGHSLTFPTDFINITKSNKEFTLKITNTSKTDATFSYSDEDVTLTLKEDEEIEFEYDEDVPGIYTVTVSAGTGGTVKSTPTADKDDKIKVGMGSEVKFTVTPSTGYILDTIKADGKTVAASSYTTSSSGVTTYTLKNVTKDQKVEITFKKGETKPAEPAWKNPFNDVSSTDSYYSAVKFVYQHELFKGVSDTRFAPDSTMTRAMFVTVLGRLANADVTRYKTSSYSDVPLNSTTSWYAAYVEWATQNGIIEGYGDGKFGPDNKITHQQMYVMMLRYTKFVENKAVNVTGVAINASDSLDVADWASEACKFASQKDFLVKTGSRIDPTGEAKRSELAQLLEKYTDTVLEWNKN